MFIQDLTPLSCISRSDQADVAVQDRKRFMQVARHQQAGQIGAEAVSLSQGMKQGIEMHRIVFERTRCRWTRSEPVRNFVCEAYHVTDKGACMPRKTKNDGTRRKRGVAVDPEGAA